MVSDRGGGQDVIGVIGVGNRLTHRLRRWKQIGGHKEQKGIMAYWFEREGDLVGMEERKPPVGVRLLVLKECIREGDQGGELVDPLRLEGMVCCCDGELKKPRESEGGGWLAARSPREMGVRMPIRNRFLRSEGRVVGHYLSTASCARPTTLRSIVQQLCGQNACTSCGPEFRAVRDTEQWYSTVESRQVTLRATYERSLSLPRALVDGRSRDIWWTRGSGESL